MKRTPGACWKCGDRFFPGHQCKKLMAMALEKEEVQEIGPEQVGFGVVEEPEETRLEGADPL